MLRSRRHQVRLERGDAGRAPVSTLRGAGPKVSAALARHGVSTIADLLWLLPTGYDDLGDPWSVARAVREAPSRPRGSVRGRVRSARYVFGRGRRGTRIELEDPEAGGPRVACLWFFLAKGIVESAKPGTDAIAIGRLSVPSRGGGAVMVHPDLLRDDASRELVRPRYPYAGVPAGRLRALVAAALDAASASVDPVPPDVGLEEGLGSAFDAAEVHRPSGIPDDSVVRRAREHLAWAEAFSRAWIRAERESAVAPLGARPLPASSDVERSLESSLGFRLTDGQRRAAREIAADLEKGEPMRRLLLGEVGSGKTAVVLFALAQAVRAEAQALVLAPTTVLAEQYGAALAPLIEATGARAAVVTAAASAAERRAAEAGAARGDVDVVVGTHWLLDERVTLPRLGLVVVDEQQRLGVLQRLALSTKGAKGGGFRPHLLTVSATPIPRTLALALVGEIATSVIEELPAGRRAPTTELVPRTRFDDSVVPRIERAIGLGEAVFYVCPRIGTDEDDEPGASAVDAFGALSARFGDRVVLGHGKMPPKELSRNVERLRAGAAAVLVGTTIVEVGLDVPRATLMVVDGAEHFGLSQLHQLRGRVGRSHLAASCLLVHDEPLAKAAKARLDALVQLKSGRDVARADLELRGAGDLGGVRQSGDSGLLYLEEFSERAWLPRVERYVARLRAEDPSLSRPEHATLRLFVDRFPSRAGVREEAG